MFVATKPIDSFYKHTMRILSTNTSISDIPLFGATLYSLKKRP